MYLTNDNIVRATLAILVCAAAASIAPAQVASPLLRDRDPLLPDAFNPPRSLVFVTRDDPDFVRFLGRPRPVVVEPAPQKPAPTPQGVEVVDGNDADRDGYVEYFDGASYVAELKQQKTLGQDGEAMRLTGTVRGLHRTNYDGFNAPHQLLRVEHENGRTALVDVGPIDALARLRLRAGDVVTVVARPGLINDRPALIADELSLGEAKVKVIRTPSVRQSER